MRNKSCLISITLIILFITACNSSNKKDVVHSNITVNTFPQKIFFNATQLNNVNVALNGIGYDGDQIASVMHSSNYSAALQPGYSPEAGAAGALIAGLFIQKMQKKAAIEEKNKPISPFLDAVESINWNSIIDNANVDIQLLSESNYDQVQRLIITPTLHISPDYRSLILTALIERKNSSSNVTYQNYIHIHSTPIISWNETITNLNLMSNQDINEHLSVMLNQLNSLIYKELEYWQSIPQKSGGRPIKFINDLKEYYERGTLLENENNFITYRTLRGEIKHIPCEKII